MARGKVEIALYVADASWNLCLLFPVFVVYWSGTWALIDLYAERWLPPDREVFGCCVCIFIGGFLMVESHFVFPLLKIFVTVSRQSVRHFVVSRTCIYVCALGGLFYWRGVWNIAVMLMGDRLETAVAVTLVALGLLVLLGSSSSPIGSPFSLSIDLRRDFYDVSTRFGQNPDKTYFYTLDVLFSVFVLVTLNVVVWVGLWKLGDLLIFPSDPSLSTVVSLAAGLGSGAVMFALWLPLDATIAYVSTEVSAALATVVQAVVNVVHVVVVLLLWRGLWGKMIEHLALSSDVVMLAWICHSVGFLVMIALQVGSTFGGVGCAVDGERQFKDWPMEYFIVYYRYRQDQRNSVRTRLAASSSEESILDEASNDTRTLVNAVVVNEDLPSD